jgi:hypothetical protein
VAQAVFDATADTLKGQEYNIIRSGVKDMMLSKFNSGKKVERDRERERQRERERTERTERREEREREREILLKFVQMLGLEVETGDMVRFVNKAVDAFFDQDLLTATNTFLGNAKGSFGLWQGFLKSPLFIFIVALLSTNF